MSLIRKPYQLEVQENIKVLIYGQPGIGKTTFALSSEKPLLLDFDGGVHRVAQAHLVDTVQISKWDDVIEVLSEDLSGYKTLIIDTAGKMLDFMAAFLGKEDPKLLKRDGSLSLQGYGARKYMFINFLNQVSRMNKHLVFVAHEKEEKDGESKIIRPEIGGSSSGDLIKELDLVGYMEAIGKKRTISFDPCEKFYGKNTCQLESVINLPDVTGKKNESLNAIFKRYTASVHQKVEMQLSYKTVLDELYMAVETIVDADSANEVVGTVMNYKGHLYDSKLKAAEAIRDKANELGLKLDTKSKKYAIAEQPEQAEV